MVDGRVEGGRDDGGCRKASPSVQLLTGMGGAQAGGG